MERLRDRFMYYSGILVAAGVNVEDLTHIANLLDAEEQGLLRKIECHCKDCVHWSDKVAGATEHVKLCTVGGYMVGENGYCTYGEAALEKMKGEEHE